MVTKISDCNLEDIKRRQTELSINLSSVRNVLMGLEYPLDKLVSKRNRLDTGKIDSIVDGVLVYTDCPEEMQAFYRELYYCAILYLYVADLRKSDIMLLSIYKIAATFNFQTTKHYFEGTTFGIMLSDLWDNAKSTKKMTDGQLAADVLKQHAWNLEEIYNNLKGQFSSADIVRDAIEIYAAVCGWSSLSDKKLYDVALSSAITAQIDAQYIMRKGRDI